jgi:hypothetical protein
MICDSNRKLGHEYKTYSEGSLGIWIDGDFYPRMRTWNCWRKRRVEDRLEVDILEAVEAELVTLKGLPEEQLAPCRQVLLKMHGLKDDLRASNSTAPSRFCLLRVRWVVVLPGCVVVFIFLRGTCCP